MKKLLITLGAVLLLASTLTAQVSLDKQDKAFKILEETDKQLAYHGDYSATISLQIESLRKTFSTRFSSAQMQSS